MEYTLNKLEPGGKYHVIVQLGNMSKDSSIKITTGKQREMAIFLAQQGVYSAVRMPLHRKFYQELHRKCKHHPLVSILG